MSDVFRLVIGHSQAHNNTRQDRQCTYRLTVRRVYETTVTVDKQSVLHIPLVCICCLSYPACNAHAPYCHLACPALSPGWFSWFRAGRSGDRIPVGMRFSTSVQTGPGAHPASYTMSTVSFPGVKRPGRGVDHPPHLTPRLKKE